MVINEKKNLKSIIFRPAPVKWAQRNDLIYLCVELLDIEKPEVQIEKDKLIYK